MSDDHARNHAAFWDGSQLSLTPAYDICPEARSGEEASQAMLIVGEQRSSQIATCLAAVAQFHMAADEAVEIVARQIETIAANWKPLCAEAGLGQVDQPAACGGRQFLNPFAFYGLEGPAARLVDQAAAIRAAA